MATARERQRLFRRWPDAVRELSRRLKERVSSDGTIRSFTVVAADTQSLIPLGTFWLECDPGWDVRAAQLLQVEVGRLDAVFDGVLQVQVDGSVSVNLPLVVASSQRVEVNRYLVTEQRRELHRRERAMLKMFANSASVIEAAAWVVEAAAAGPAMKRKKANKASRQAEKLVELAKNLVEVAKGGGSGQHDDQHGADETDFDDGDDGDSEPTDFWNLGTGGPDDR